MNCKHSKYSLTVIVVALLFCSCKKFLDAKPDKTLTIPSTLTDLRLLLDAYSKISMNYPNIAEALSDNYYMTSADWSALSTENNRNYYIWQPVTDDGNYWRGYGTVNDCNIVLDYLPRILYSPNEQPEYDNLKGCALLIRSAYFFGMVQVFAKQYDATTAHQDLGIPLRLNSDYNEVSVRASVQETYDRITSDLKESVKLLPQQQAIKTRPNKAAAYGWLARTYLSMKDYDNAGLYADSCLRLYDSLMDFNSLNASATAPISRFNKEVIFHLSSLASTPYNPTRAKIDSNLYNSYHANDLRKTVYFKANTGANAGTYAFKGDYDGSGINGIQYAGIITDEMYLIRAECYARAGNTPLALKDLNTLLKTRWKAGLFSDVTATDANDALSKILIERRKELLFRGTRWSDLRRLMNEGAFSVTPRRIINNQTYDLPPNSPRYVLKIPQQVIDMTGIPQNP